MSLSTVASVQFEQSAYTVLEGEAVEVCAIKDSETAIPTIVNLITEDESAESKESKRTLV